jgi:hypothetical protein
MYKLFKFEVSCGRMGDLEGIFTATQEEVDSIIGKRVYFGEVLGKHSDIFLSEGNLKSEHIILLSDDQEFVTKFIEILGKGTISGINPLDYIEESDEE